MLQSFSKKNKLLFLLFLIFLISEILIDPRGNYPLNDDWSYSKSVLNWHRDGVYNIGDWPAMTLFTHLFWGLLFTKIAGFSFFVLRVSTLISSLIGIITLFKLIEKITKNSRTAFFGSMVLLYNPIYFNLSNTYMTDITFNTLLLLCCYFSYDFFQDQKLKSFLLVFVLSVFLVLTRQFGIVVPIAFFLSCLTLRKRKVYYVTLAMVFTALTLVVLKLYEHYLQQILPPGAAYKFSADSNPLMRIFWDTLFMHFRDRYATVLLHLFIFTFPFSIIYVLQLFKETAVWRKGAVLAGAALFTFVVFYREPFPMGNVFVNIGLGTRTFYEYLSINSTKGLEHASSQTFEDAMHWVKLFIITANSIIVILAVYKSGSLRKNIFSGNPELPFFVILTLAYCLLLFMTESYFDRYHLPLIMLGILLFSYIGKKTEVNYKLAIVPLLLLFYISVSGTRDYMQINTIRWKAYHHLVKERKIMPSKINGGFEVNCWNEGEHSTWYTFMDLKDFDYLIQFWKEPGFKNYKEYPFQRYFPFEKDKIYIFERDRTPLVPEQKK